MTFNGWINLDKACGPTSNQALGKVRKLFYPQKKLGHAGTLDPLASGILPIALGEATKTIAFAQDHIKTYSFKIIFGEERDTDDLEGKIVNSSDKLPLSQEIINLLPEFTGNISQTPPRFSAIKIDGKRAYDMARKGEKVEIRPREVFVKSLELTSFDGKEAILRTVCGKGTYIRSIARDMGRKLGCYGCVGSLRREAVGPFTLDNAISLDILEKMSKSARLDEVLLPLATVLDDIPALAISEKEAVQLKNGQRLVFVSKPDTDRIVRSGIEIDTQNAVRALAQLNGLAIAMVEITGVKIKPVRVFNL